MSTASLNGASVPSYENKDVENENIYDDVYQKNDDDLTSSNNDYNNNVTRNRSKNIDKNINGKSTSNHQKYGGGYKSRLNVARSRRKQVDSDARLLQNRIALLKLEEHKAWKRIVKTKSRYIYNILFLSRFHPTLFFTEPLL